MATLAYQITGFAYQGVGVYVYQGAETATGTGALLAGVADITGSGTVTGGGGGGPTGLRHIHLDWSGILHKEL